MASKIRCTGVDVTFGEAAKADDFPARSCTPSSTCTTTSGLWDSQVSGYSDRGGFTTSRTSSFCFSEETCSEDLGRSGSHWMFVGMGSFVQGLGDGVPSQQFSNPAPPFDATTTAWAACSAPPPPPLPQPQLQPQLGASGGARKPHWLVASSSSSSACSLEPIGQQENPSSSTSRRHWLLASPEAPQPHRLPRPRQQVSGQQWLPPWEETQSIPEEDPFNGQFSEVAEPSSSSWGGALAQVAAFFSFSAESSEGSAGAEDVSSASLGVGGNSFSQEEQQGSARDGFALPSFLTLPPSSSRSLRPPPVKYTFIHYDDDEGSDDDGESTCRTQGAATRSRSAPPELHTYDAAPEARQVSSAMLARHKLGNCRPCAYFRQKQDGCRLGNDCSFCHVCLPGELKKRKKERVKALKVQRRESRLSGQGSTRARLL